MILKIKLKGYPVLICSSDLNLGVKFSRFLKNFDWDIGIS